MYNDGDDGVGEARAYEVAMARVRYIDLCQHGQMSKSEFFGEAGFKELEVYGLTLELPDVVRVLFYDDLTDDSECEGIAIPHACVVSIDWLVSSNPTGLDLLSNDSSVN